MPSDLLITSTIASFANFALALSITQLEGPASVFDRLRTWAGSYEYGPQQIDGRPVPATALGRAMVCPYCVGTWTAVPLALLILPYRLDVISWLMEVIILWLAIAGATFFMLRL